jgi:D-glucuronyl C5-epimerase C-terminus
VILLRLQERLQAARPEEAERSIKFVRLIHLPLIVAGLLALAAPAAASPVLVMAPNGHVTRENDRFTPPAGPAPKVSIPARSAQSGSVRSVLDSMLAGGQIKQAEHDQRLQDYNDALFIRNQLGGTRKRELNGVISLLNGLAGRGQVTKSRLNVLWLQLNRNTEWWGFSDRIPGTGERVRFKGSRVMFQYFPGQGLEWHPLANWGRLQALIKDGYNENAKQFLAELLPLGSERGGALTWEYFFYFGGGGPPWTSGLSQGTALVGLINSYKKLGTPAYLAAAKRALKIYTINAPTGVRVKTKRGTHYAEYSFSPGVRIINGFIQALNGIWDVRPYSSLARSLYRAGDREARFELPKYDTGRWSRYDNTRGSLSPLNYHVLLRDFLRELCGRTHTSLYCAKASRFTAYLRKGPP